MLEYEDPVSFNELVNAIVEFIEVAIHTILYVRQVYPAEIFVRRKKYDTPVFQSRHPALNEYISGAIKAVGDELMYGKVDKVVIVIKDKQEVALERFIISVEYMTGVHGFNKDISYVSAIELSKKQTTQSYFSVEDAVTASSLIQYFRSFMVKLNMIETQISQISTGDDLSFAVVLELKDDEAPSHSDTNEDPPPWIPAVTQHTSAGAEKKAQFHMVRAVNTGVINLSLGVQESADKIKRELEKRSQKKKQAAQERLSAAGAAPIQAPTGEAVPEAVPPLITIEEPHLAPVVPPAAPPPINDEDGSSQNAVTAAPTSVEPPVETH
ncbi:DNA-binding protein [Crepidotus variabilis]|uniref:DNA-binding protein n=1 Tax=Crepidotus variabilis TaxID=179855 RepID=A0A9P6EVM5_9AGAR|nr:DNA-binding protein [Crepidotus variabilis]